MRDVRVNFDSYNTLLENDNTLRGNKVNVRCSLTNDCHLVCPCKLPHHKTKSCNKYCSLYTRARCIPYIHRQHTKFTLGFKPIIEVDPVIDKKLDAYFAKKKIMTKKILINKK